MNSRERVQAAINHQEPDKVPIDLATTTVTGIGIGAYQCLREFLGLDIEPNPIISHIHQGIVYPSEEVYRLYRVDMRPVYMRKAPRGSVVVTMPDGSFYDEYGMRWSKGLYDYSPVSSPMSEYTLDDLMAYSWPDEYDSERVRGLREQAQDLYKNTDYAIVADIMCRGPFESAVKLRGYEKFLMDLYLEPEFAAALLDKITDHTIALWDAYLSAVGEYVQIVCQGDDLGTQTNLIMGPQLYRKFIKPCHKRIYEYIHSRTDAKVFMHSCGAIYDIIPDLIEIGVDILNPIQRSAKGMDIGRLKRDFGSDICFWGGGIDVQALPQFSPNQIEDEINRTIEILAPGGGFVFAPTHNIHVDVTSDKIDKVYNTVMKYGGDI